MTLAAVLLLGLGALLAEPVPLLLARAGWPQRAPRPALVLWQAVGLAAGVAAIGAGVLYGVAPLAGSVPAGVWALAVQAGPGSPFAGLGWPHLLALLAAAVLAGRLLGVLLTSTARTLRDRHRHRTMVDLLGTPWPDLGGARVLAHPDAVAYCLPGLRARVVLSAGTLRLLNAEELAGVLAHERAHVSERHDLVVLPFVAWGAALPFVRGVRRAQAAVASLVEMVADDRARMVADPGALASAIARVGSVGAPRGALAAGGPAGPAGLGGAGDSVVLARVTRLLDPPPPVPRWLPVAVYVGAALLILLPALPLLLPGS
ncbi:MAG TPA: M56 family metallopeptidase [Mycobacteriales bacterium]|nr:M56 family metallopeptidase [Mycobacteriales bacterium]